MEQHPAGVSVLYRYAQTIKLINISMKKLWSIVLMALMMVGMAACTEGDSATDGTGNSNDNGGTNNGAGVSFTAVVKGSEAAADVWANAWCGEETINVEAEGKVYAFTNSEADKARFTCTAEGVEAIVGKSVVVTVDDSDMSKMGTAGIAAESTIESFDPAKSIELKAQNALLKYTLTGKGKVTFEMDYLAFRHNGGNNASVSFMEVEGTNYVSFLPGTKGEVELNISVDGTLWSTKRLTPAAGVVYDLGTLVKGDNGNIEGGGNEDKPTTEGMVYLVPNIWDADEAWFVAYYFNSAGDNAAVTLTKNSEGIYEGAVPAGMEGMLFVRMNPAYTDFAWNDETVTDRVWNQTGDLLIGIEPNNCFYILDWATGEWGTKDNPVVPTPKSPWAVAGTFNTWSNLAMEFTDADNIFVAREVTLIAGDEFKIKAAENWDTAYGKDITLDADHYTVVTTGGGEQDNVKVATAGCYDIYFELGDSSKVYLITTGGDRTAAVEQTTGGNEGGDEGGNTGVASNIGLVGSFQGWDVTASIAMVETADGWVAATGVELYKSDEFKFVEGDSWDNPSYGNPSAILVAEVDTEYTLTSDNGQNIRASKNGKFDIFFNTVSKAFKYTCTEEYTGITVDITVDNKAGWEPLNIYLEYNGTAITPAAGAPVVDGKYSISGDYIGSSLLCKFLSGSKVSEPQNITVTKSGATVTLDENIIKLVFRLDTDNSKQWWGENAYIHVWNTNSSFDTTWPGTQLTSEGEYTWSIIVPAELTGKSINYLIHNGNGWQSKDSTITINAEGNTVTGSSIGIN